MAVKVCPGCGEGNKESAFVCVVCGSSLKDVVPQGTMNSDKDFVGSLSGRRKQATHCSHCEQPLEEGAMKCRYCGTLTTRSAPEPSHYYEEARSVPDSAAMTMLVISTILIPVVGLIVGGVASFDEDENKQDTGKLLLGLGLGVLVVQLIIFLFLM